MSEISWYCQSLFLFSNKLRVPGVARVKFEAQKMYLWNSNPNHKWLTWPGSKIFDPDPSLPTILAVVETRILWTHPVHVNSTIFPLHCPINPCNLQHYTQYPLLPTIFLHAPIFPHSLVLPISLHSHFYHWTPEGGKWSSVKTAPKHSLDNCGWKDKNSSRLVHFKLFSPPEMVQNFIKIGTFYGFVGPMYYRGGRGGWGSHVRLQLSIICFISTFQIKNISFRI